ncbi:MAG: hypothetical protein JNJ98_14445 [Gemmatimonadetes bacterium]|nr:hypothetical protein [Gemmatimonadota bacterium]
MMRRLTVRQLHRWLSLVFLAAVLANTVVVLRGGYNNQLGSLAVAPLLVLLVTGLYLFVQPYVAKRRAP